MAREGVLLCWKEKGMTAAHQEGLLVILHSFGFEGRVSSRSKAKRLRDEAFFFSSNEIPNERTSEEKTN